MTVQIRKSVFETNSSSTHSICIAKQKPERIPEVIHFGIRNFGWEWRTLYGQEKANYLYTMILGQPNHRESMQKLVKLLDKIGVQYQFEEPVFEKIGKFEFLDNGSIDHASEGADFVNAVLHSQSRLERYLFSDGSFIKTGNDNDDGTVEIDVNYPHEEYYKWN
jgi:hypothetical protein